MKSAPQLDLQPLNTNLSIVDQAYLALKEATKDADIYGYREKFGAFDRAPHQIDRVLGWAQGLVSALAVPNRVHDGLSTFA